MSKSKFFDRPTVHFALEMAREFVRAVLWLAVSLAFSFGRDLLVQTGRPSWMIAVATCVEIFSFIVAAFVLCFLLLLGAVLTVLPSYRKVMRALKRKGAGQKDLSFGVLKKKR